MLRTYLSLPLESSSPISPYLELGAFEYLWKTQEKQSFKKLSQQIQIAGSYSELVDENTARHYADIAMKAIREANALPVGFRISGTIDYPYMLKDADYPAHFLYFRGDWNLAFYPKKIAVVGTRAPSADGIARVKRLVRAMVAHDIAIVSGLAKGIDTYAHMAAVANNGVTIGVIGTPITDAYPRENKGLQEHIAKHHLLISQIPILRYHAQNFKINRFFFPERNITMSAISDATVIIEAGETSGTLVQARAALKQGRKLFILDSCFQNKNITWPAKYEEKGAIRVRTEDDILSALGI